MPVRGGDEMTAAGELSPLLAKCLPVDESSEIKFSEPWEAKAFAIIVELAQAGRFSWPEWVETFSKEVAAASALEARGLAAPTYYEQWLQAAENILIEKGFTTAAQLEARKFALQATGTMHALR